MCLSSRSCHPRINNLCSSQSYWVKLNMFDYVSDSRQLPVIQCLLAASVVTCWWWHTFFPRLYFWMEYFFQTMFPVKEVQEAMLALRRAGYSSYLLTHRVGSSSPPTGPTNMWRLFLIIFNRPGVAGAVLQKASSFICSFIKPRFQKNVKKWIGGSR